MPRATVLAEPAACMHLSSRRDQYADVGMSASAMQVKSKIKRQSMNDGLRP